ncbi:Ribosomal 50S subunit-recycling heat shock protein, contains S4 domain [Seinonella peptonophila]|uniref:RQC P-site tRNA stabilizing factor n=1 Tax=Seinonella peptonophila TaxID=112248 RepID=A0A1M4YRT4_9BACL|nr:RNA-binding S4 domain-containing protein [Seinonella peptonophila]SHF08388.1 Ribosomal 50S subunit-recycling heat shock protein, contains S4 domain [Seinonella peptonophila]
MRIDKFLKVSRLIKRRTVAKEFCDQGRVSVNDRIVGAGHQLSVGDQVAIRFGQKVLTIEVQQLLEKIRKEEAEQMYRLVKEEALSSS